MMRLRKLVVDEQNDPPTVQLTVVESSDTQESEFEYTGRVSYTVNTSDSGWLQVQVSVLPNPPKRESVDRNAQHTRFHS